MSPSIRRPGRIECAEASAPTIGPCGHTEASIATAPGRKNNDAITNTDQTAFFLLKRFWMPRPISAPTRATTTHHNASSGNSVVQVPSTLYWVM